jgi:hypothetical protein
MKRTGEEKEGKERGREEREGEGEGREGKRRGEHRER